MSSHFKSLDISKVQTTSLRKRPCRLHIDMLGQVPDPTRPLQDFFRSMPRVGACNELLAAADALTLAALSEKSVICLIDSTFLEMGLSALVVKMIQRGLIRAVAMTGRAAQRDYELALYGRTQEDVRMGLEDGLLGLSRETGEGMNKIVNEGVQRGFGLGECLGRGILDRQPKHFTKSIMAACAARLAQCTVHASIGADGFHRHPEADGAMLGKGSLRDLQLLGAKSQALNDGGVILAAHSDPALQEVFYQAYAAGRNQGHAIDRISLIRFGEGSPDYGELPGVENAYLLPGPIELIFPLFTGVVFSMVE